MRKGARGWPQPDRLRKRLTCINIDALPGEILTPLEMLTGLQNPSQAQIPRQAGLPNPNGFEGKFAPLLYLTLRSR